MHFDTDGNRVALNRVTFTSSAHHPKHHGTHAKDGKNGNQSNRRQRDQDGFFQFVAHEIVQTI